MFLVLRLVRRITWFRGAPTIWPKIVPKRATMALFLFFWWGTAGFDVRSDETYWDCSQIAELQTYVGFLTILPTGRVLKMLVRMQNSM